MKHTKESLKQALLNDKYDLDEVDFKLDGYDLELRYLCDTGFQEGANGGIYYTIHIERTKIDSEVSSLFADTKEEAVEEVMNQLDDLLNIDNDTYIKKEINRYKEIIIELEEKLENKKDE